MTFMLGQTPSARSAYSDEDDITNSCALTFSDIRLLTVPPMLSMQPSPWEVAEKFPPCWDTLKG